MKNYHNIQVSNKSQNICSLFMSYVYQPKIKCKGGGSYFSKSQKYWSLQIQKKKNSVNSFQKMPIFHISVFSENAQCFVGAFLERLGYGLFPSLSHFN